MNATTTPLRFELIARTDTPTTTVITAELIPSMPMNRTLIWTLVSNADGTDVIVDPTGKHRTAVGIIAADAGTTAHQFLDWVAATA